MMGKTKVKLISTSSIPAVITTSTLGGVADGVPAYKGFDYDSAAAPKKKAKHGYQKCAHSHPPLKIRVDAKDREYTVYGGACGSPIHEGLDIYVALDHGTAHDPQAWPWHGSRQFIYFPITDMSVPKDAAEFKLMIEWLCDQIVAGKSVHVGCIGGHGRTGMVLAALVKMLGGEDDAITYVRQNYCEKAVETKTQCEWLAKNFGITVVGGAKEPKAISHKSDYEDRYPWDSSTSKGQVYYPKQSTARVNELAKQYSGEVVEVAPFMMTGNIWGAV